MLLSPGGIDKGKNRMKRDIVAVTQQMIRLASHFSLYD